MRQLHVPQITSRTHFQKLLSSNAKFSDSVSINLEGTATTAVIAVGSRIFPPGHFAPDISPEKNVNNVVEIKAGLMKQYLLS